MAVSAISQAVKALGVCIQTDWDWIELIHTGLVELISGDLAIIMKDVGCIRISARRHKEVAGWGCVHRFWEFMIAVSHEIGGGVCS